MNIGGTLKPAPHAPHPFFIRTKIKTMPTILVVLLCWSVCFSSSFSPAAFTSKTLQQKVIVVSRTSPIHLGERTRITTKVRAADADYFGNVENGVTSFPQSFRDAEVQGLRLMQQEKHLEALECFQKGLKLPGSRMDIVRTQSLSGPSPVGGASGGRTSQVVQSLDEFEFQAAYYNIACAYACLGQNVDAVENLRKSFEYGFDNFKACAVDPDLRGIQASAEFNGLMDSFDPKQKGGIFNPLKFFS